MYLVEFPSEASELGVFFVGKFLTKKSDFFNGYRLFISLSMNELSFKKSELTEVFGVSVGFLLYIIV